jgi:acyl dehydratase
MVNKNLLGMEAEPAVAEVKAEEIILFAKAIGDLNPLYIDEAAAKRSPFGAIVAPPTFPVPFQAISMDMSLFADLDLNIASLVHGEQEFEYFKVLKAGDKITIRAKVADMYEKEGKSGILDFVIFEAAGYDEKGEKVYICRTTLISKRA